MATHRRSSLVNLVGLDVDVDRQRILWQDGRDPTKLTTQETAVIRVLAERAPDVVDRDQLGLAIWGHDRPEVRKYVDNLVYRLRQKIERDPKKPENLVTVHGQGYRLFQTRRPPAVDGHPTHRAKAFLPTLKTPFIGRAKEIATVRSRFDEGARLVTLMGPGGIGKTRVALQLVPHLCESAEGNALRFLCFCELAQVERIEDVVPLVAEALGCGTGARAFDEFERRIEHALTDVEGLMVLDNLEQLEADALDWIERLLQRIPGLRVLTTSRHALDRECEFRVEVHPLTQGESAEVFIERAQRVGRDLEVADEELAMLITELQGVPLALELAAGRTQTMSVSELRKRLAEGLGVLRSRRTRTADRQRTMEAAVAWSWGMLLPAERDLLMKLAVLPGGLELDIAWSVGGEDLIDSLHAKSLVRIRRASMTVVDLLHVVRSFVRSRTDIAIRHASIAEWASVCLPRWGAEPIEGPLRSRHRSANLWAMAERLVALRSPLAGQALLQLQRDASHQWNLGKWCKLTEIALVEMDGAPAIHLQLVLSEVLYEFGREADSYGHAEAAHARSIEAADPGLVIRCELVLAKLDMCAGAVDAALGRTRTAKARLQNVPDESSAARAGVLLAQLAYFRPSSESEAEFQEALDLSRRSGRKATEAAVQTCMGLWHGRDEFNDTEYSRALEAFGEATRIYGELGMSAELAQTTMDLALIQHRMGRTEDAAEGLRNTIRTLRSLGLAQPESVALVRLAWVQQTAGELKDAEGSLRRSLALRRASQNPRSEAFALARLGHIMLETGALESADRLYEQALPTLRDAEVELELLQVGRALLAHKQGRQEQAEARLADLAAQGASVLADEVRRAWQGAPPVADAVIVRWMRQVAGAGPA